MAKDQEQQQDKTVSKEQREKIIQKAKKLLDNTTGKGRTDAEMETAMGLLTKLLDKHDLELDVVREWVADDTSYVNEILIGDYERQNMQSHYIVQILSEFFQVSFVSTQQGDGREWQEDFKWDARELHVLGMKHHVEISHFVYDFLQGTFQKMYDLYDKYTVRKIDATSFYKGLYEGLRQKLWEQRRKDLENASGGSQALVLLSNKLQEFKNKEYQNLESVRGPRPSNIDPKVARIGKDMGYAINIREGVDGNAKRSGQVGRGTAQLAN